MEREGISLALPSGPAETASNRLAGVGGEGQEVLTEGGGERISQVHPCHLGRGKDDFVTPGVHTYLD